jgi:hypothetical protein
MPRLVGTTTATIKHMTEQVCDQRPERFLLSVAEETTTPSVVRGRHSTHEGIRDQASGISAVSGIR